MATLQQIEANRRNASLSTGPRTPEGKAAVRFNALTHGLRSRSVVLPGENPEEFQQLCDDFACDLHPQGPIEQALVEQMAIAQWKLARCDLAERYLFEENGNELDRLPRPPEKKLTLAEIVGATLQFPASSKALERISAFQSRLERSFFRALRELQRLQTARRRQPQPPPASPEEEERIDPPEQPAPSRPSAEPAASPAPVPPPDNCEREPAAASGPADFVEIFPAPRHHIR